MSELADFSEEEEVIEDDVVETVFCINCKKGARCNHVEGTFCNDHCPGNRRRDRN